MNRRVSFGYRGIQLTVIARPHFEHYAWQDWDFMGSVHSLEPRIYDLRIRDLRYTGPNDAASKWHL